MTQTTRLAWAAFALATSIAQAGRLYNFVTIDGAGDNAGGTVINGISNTGAVAGFSSNANQTVFTNFVRNPNGKFSALNINNDPMAMANDVNTTGVVVGTTNGQAFTLSSGLLAFLPAVVPGETASKVAFGINDYGSTVGQFVDNNTDTTPGFVDINGQFTILNPVANAVATNAQSINNQGLVTGFYSTDGQHQHGFFYNTSTGQYFLPADPVQPNLFLTQFLGINDNGLAVGYWQDVVGDQHGFIYNLNARTYTFLDDPNEGTNRTIITQITGINDSNEIAGFYADANALQHGFIATAATPEPASIALLLSGFIGLLWRMRANRQSVRHSDRHDPVAVPAIGPELAVQREHLARRVDFR